jgi:type I restriction enzyme R subunit
VKAHHKFNDADWDGEPVEPEAPTAKPLPPSWQRQDPTEQPKVREPGEDRPPKLVVKLADGKTRSIQHISSTSYWGPDGKPLSPAQFLESLFGALPDFFKNEDELRTLWADPNTRKALLGGLADKGFGRDPLREMQRIIDAEKSDLYDVLAYVAFALPTETRASRAQRAKAHNAVTYGEKQQAFLAFVLDQYVTQGVDELDSDKLTPLLKLRYNNALHDAMEDLGDAVQVRLAFVGMQRYLYN